MSRSNPNDGGVNSLVQPTHAASGTTIYRQNAIGGASTVSSTTTPASPMRDAKTVNPPLSPIREVKPAKGKGGNVVAGSEQDIKEKKKTNRVGSIISADTNIFGSQFKDENSTRRNRLALFDHLPRNRYSANAHSIEETNKRMDDVKEKNAEPISLHPATIKLGLLYRKGIIFEDDDRVVALIAAFCNMIDDYTTPTTKRLCTDLDKYIGRQVDYLVKCRVLCIGMGNLVRYLKHEITHTPPDTYEADAKQKLKDSLQSFLEKRIIEPRDAILMHVAAAIKENDCILTYGSSPLIRYILEKIAETKNFRLIIVDSRPLHNGLKTLATLSSKVHCIYTPLCGAAAAMRETTRVLLGASALLSNGAILGAAGTAMIASLARAQRVPVIFAAEIYKFSEKNQLDSIVFNELGDESEVLRCRKSPEGAAVTEPSNGSEYIGSSNSSGNCSLPFQVINLRYDLTNIINVSVVATENGLIPATSIPVLIREMRPDIRPNER